MGMRDLILIVVAFSAITAGIFLPQAAEPLDGFPRVSLMIILFLSFLGLRCRQLIKDALRLHKYLAVMTVSKLFIAPLVTFFLFTIIMPEFAIGALLLAGTPMGVISAFFALILRAEFTLALTGVVLTSLLSPFTLPFITSLGLAYLGYEAHAMERFSPLQMSLEMAMLIIIPFILSQICFALVPKISQKLIEVRFWINTTSIGISNLAVFAKYSPTLRESPDLLLPALGATLICGLTFFICGATIAWRWLLPQQVSMAVCLGVSNGVMAMILGMEFFGLYEALPGALFAIPTVLVLFPTRLLIRLRTGHSFEIPSAKSGGG
ncbi:MAG: bile acid:sodium symporter family protein [Candidatus Adiutrix sp.]